MAEPHDPIDPQVLEAELARPLEDALLDVPTVETPPAGFADRVLAARPIAAASPSRARRTRSAFAVAGAALLVAGLLGRSLLRGAEEGEARVSARTSLALGDRGVAVAEAGAALHWRVMRGRAEIDQTAGSVFYRVERGGPFWVHTPAGDVEVRGTCFNVEVRDMKIGRQGIVGAGMGAAVAASIVVAVYEGRVSLANEHGQVTLAAGERATAAGASAPRALAPGAVAAAELGPAPAALSHEALLQRAEAQQQEVAALRAQVHALEARGGEEGDARGRGKAADDAYLHPTKEQLTELAKDCKLVWDEPKIGIQPSTVGPDRAVELGLTDEERQALNKVNADFNSKTIADLRALYIDVTGDSAGADALSPGSMIEEIQEKSPRTDIVAAFQRLSAERAGLRGAPTDARGASPVERLMRLRISAGDRYEHELGASIGPDLARRLREKDGGWGSRHSSSYGCPDGR